MFRHVFRFELQRIAAACDEVGLYKTWSDICNGDREMAHYIDADYIQNVLQWMNRIDHEGYYVKMAVAWALSVCYVKFPKETMLLLKENRLDDFTYNKALQKITESFRVSPEDKDIIRDMKRKVVK